MRSDCTEARAGAVGVGREGRGRIERYCSKALTGRLYKNTSEWMTGGPERSNHIPKQSRVRDTWRKRWRENRGVYALSHPSAAVRPASRASPNFVSHKIRERQIDLSGARSPAIRRSGIVKFKRSLDERKEWIESTEEKLLVINKEIIDPRERIPSTQKQIGNNINSFLTQASIHSGANDGVMYLG